MFSEDTVQRYSKALYPVGAMLLIVPSVDILLRQFPPQFDGLQWRFGAVGLFLGNLGTIMLGLGLLGLVAAIRNDRRALRIVGFLSLFIAVVLVGSMALFSLDAIQIRRLAAVNFKRQILTSSLGALCSGVLGLVATVVMGRAALTSARGTPTNERRVKSASPIVVGARSHANESA